MNTLNLEQIGKVLAVEMTAKTGEIWRMVKHPDRLTHIESATACLSLSEVWNTHRLTIQATAPHNIREPRNGQTITCDPKRKPEAIAGDICARLLTHAREHLRESIQYHEEETREEAIQNLTDHYLKKELPHEWHSYGSAIYFTNAYDKEPNTPEISAHREYDGLIEVKTKLPLQQALKLIQQLKG